MGKGGPKTPEGKAKALANLRPMKPGETLNPHGRPAAGVSLKEWVNLMQGWTKAELDAAVADAASPASKVAAARRWLAACSDEHGAGADFDRIMDRTEGKPQQSVTVEAGVHVTHADAVQGAMAKVLTNPDAYAAAEALAAHLAGDATDAQRPISAGD